MARFMEIKSTKPKVKQSEIAKELCYSSITLKRYRNDKNMLLPYRIQSNTDKRKQKISNTEHEPIRSQMNSNDPIVNSETKTVEPIKPVKSKTKMKGGANIEIN